MARSFQGEQFPIDPTQIPYYSSVEAPCESLDPFQGKQPPAFGGSARAPRQMVNLVSVVLALFVPWLLFIITFGVLTFSLHYEQALTAYTVNGITLLFVLFLGVSALDTKKKTRGTPSLQVFTFATSFLAWSCAVIFGDFNFYHYMQPFYDLYNLNSYRNIDPSLDKGQRLMDAGQITFVEGSGLDRGMTMGFKNLDTYCVVPIGKRNQTKNGNEFMPLATYDFWAIGLNCCSDNTGGDFRCGEYNMPGVRAGLRLMKDEQRAYFRLAVQQAEAAFNIKASHPLFLHWMQDPSTEMFAYQDGGYSFYIVGVMYYFAIQLFMTGGAVLMMLKGAL